MTVTGTPPAAMAFEGPRLVAEGMYDLGVTTPSWYVTMAQDGKGPYSEPLRVRSLATFAHNDRLVFAVRARTGITSLREIKERAAPLKISMPARELGHGAGWAIDQVLAQYGFSQEDVQSWGGEILRDRPRSQNSLDEPPVDPSFDAIFDEAIMTRRWQRISAEYDLRFLALDPDVQSRCAELGMKPGVLEQARLPGVLYDVPTIDFSGWTLYCAEDFPEAWAYLVAKAIDEQKEAISARFNYAHAGLTSPVDMTSVARDAPGALHPGAQAYYAEMGLLP